MRKFVTNVLQEHAVSDIETNMMVLAVDEVCSNIIIHGQCSNEEEHVKITISFEDDGVWFDIMDKGAAFDILTYNEPVLDDLIKTKKKGGVGILLVKKIMDKIEFNARPDQNTLRLFKKLEPQK